MATNTWDRQIIIGNTGGEGGHDIYGANPNYKPGTYSPTSPQGLDSDVKWGERSKAIGSRGRQYNWTGSRNRGRWDPKYAQNIETDKVRIMNRKRATEEALYGDMLKDWKGNEWMKKALDQAWETDYKGYRTMNLSRTMSKIERTSTGGEGGHEVEKIVEGGYHGLNKEGLSQFAHEMVGRAGQVHSAAIRAKESEARIGAQRARGGMGSRGSTILTGGREGVLSRAKTKRSTLIGA